jgi:subtilisin family serine protease
MKTLFALASAAVLSACASAPMMNVDNATLPEVVRVPMGQKVMMTTTGIGELTYECREKKDMAGQHEWVFVGPVATLYGSGRKVVGKYYAGPTWESSDGSKVTGKQLAVALAGTANIPLQLVKAEPATGAGAMAGVTYIQRLNTKGGVAPATACNAAAKGQRQQVAYEADYVFYGS